MSADNGTVIAPNGCPIESLPEDPTHLFSSKGITLDLPRIGWIASGCFTVLSTAISLVLIYRHCQYYTKPNQQRYIVRMLLMVPIYAITSWFSFVYVREAVYYDTIRVLYEAFVIASFLILLLQYLGDSLEDQKRALKRHKKTERWFFPLCCLKYNPSRPHFLQYMKWGILQYVPLNVFATVLTIVLQIQGAYCESSWNPKFGHVWILIINTTSVTIATYFLIMFYFTIREDLKEYSPFYKFLAVKLVIFFSFWQSVLIEGLVYFGFIKATTYWSTNDISVGINAVLIDVEMVFFALMHLKAFSYKPYVPLVPNPDLPQHQQGLLSNNSAGNNNNNNNNYNGNGDGDLNSNDTSPNHGNLNQNEPNSNRLQQQQQQPQRSLTGRRKPPPGADPNPDSDPTDRTTSKSKDKKGGKDTEPPEMIMDLTQKTHIWKGLLDSFNPLDTLRELSYGVMYMYRWARGIPVDKDSRRLLDLERAFGRQRPEVPYVPTKEEEEEEKRKKDKKAKKKNKKDLSDLDSGNDDGDDDDDHKPVRNRAQEEDVAIEKGGANIDGNDDGDNYDGGGYGRSNRDRDLFVGDYGPRNDRAGTDPYYAPGFDFSNLPGLSQQQPQPQQRRTDTAYDMGYGESNYPMGTIRSGGIGGGGGATAETATVGRSVARKPVSRFAIINNATTAATNPTPAATPGPGGRPGKQQQQQRMPSVEYLDKEDAARTERATLPDIQPEPVIRKIALSGLYVDGPDSPGDSSLDIPMPMSFQQHHPLHQQLRQQQQQQQYQQQWPYQGRYDARNPGARNWGWDGEREQQNVQEREPLWQGQERSDREPVRFEHRDRDLERAAAAPPTVGTANYVLPTPVPFISTRPDPTRRDIGGHVAVEGGDLQTAVDRNYVARGDTVQRERELGKSNVDPNTSGTAVAAAAEATRIEIVDRDLGSVAPAVTAAATATTTTALQKDGSHPKDNSTSHAVPDRQFYHHREASRSDPEVSRFGLDYEESYQEEELFHPGKLGQDRFQTHYYESDPILTDQIAALAVATSTDEKELGPRQDLQHPDVQDSIDPIVAQYNQLQNRQRLQEQQRQQEELRLQREQQRQQQKEQQQQQQQQREQPRQQPLHVKAGSTSRPSQHQQATLRRRNSLESLDSDSTVSGRGAFRAHAAAVGLYNRDYGGYGVSHGSTSSSSAGGPSRENRYQRAYRYPMPLPQPVPPAQFYRFPQDRDMYERRKREQQQQQRPQQQQGRPLQLQQQQHQPLPYGAPLSTLSSAYQQGRDKRDRGYDDESRMYDRPARARQDLAYDRPYFDEEDSYSRYTQRPEPSHLAYGRADAWYQSPPPRPMDTRGAGAGLGARRPVEYGGGGGPDPELARRPMRNDYYRDDGEDLSRQGPIVEEGVLFPASRYAAPFLRDYEMQQREERRRMTGPATAAGGGGGGDVRGAGYSDRSLMAPSPLGPGVGRRRGEFQYDDGGTGVVWTRPHLPPVPRRAVARPGGSASFERS
ncbi:hypothetical protein BGZ99_001154 [Dissophora globulifera]|uniref:DUF300-domain-containing protein n=1 Tax=Dissophora globulifera TaxID=979702 RepID=A0A9P6RPX6_9FUNG|nr:hypothetical protein BGZ99_001154 [Dissophora globulifera]